MLQKLTDTEKSSTIKPHKGTISNWEKVYFPKYILADTKHLEYVIKGTPHGHPDFPGAPWIITSPVVKHEGNTIETINSRYTLDIEKQVTQ